MTSYLITMVTDSHQTCVKMCLKICIELLNKAFADENHLGRIQEKPYGRVQPLPLYFRGLSWPVSQSVSQSVRQSFSQSVSQSVRQSISQSVSQSVRQSISHSVSQSVRQSVSQSVSQSDSQLVSQAVSHTRHPLFQQCFPEWIMSAVRNGRLCYNVTVQRC